METIFTPLLGKRYVLPSGTKIPVSSGFVHALDAHLRPARPEKRRKNALDAEMPSCILVANTLVFPDQLENAKVRFPRPVSVMGPILDSAPFPRAQDRVAGSCAVRVRALPLVLWCANDASRRGRS